MRPLAALGALALGLSLWASAAVAQSLTVVGLDGKETTVSAEQLADMPRGKVEAPWGETPTVYEGPKLVYVLRAAGVPVGARLHGDPMMAVVLATGGDGFTALYALPEVDSGFHDGTAILADTADGKPLADKQAPWRLVLAADRKPWRSVYALTRIEVRSVAQKPPAPMSDDHAH